jgi:hypothetical protein
LYQNFSKDCGIYPRKEDDGILSKKQILATRTTLENKVFEKLVTYSKVRQQQACLQRFTISAKIKGDMMKKLLLPLILVVVVCGVAKVSAPVTNTMIAAILGKTEREVLLLPPDLLAYLRKRAEEEESAQQGFEDSVVGDKRLAHDGFLRVARDTVDYFMEVTLTAEGWEARILELAGIQEALETDLTEVNVELDKEKKEDLEEQKTNLEQLIGAVETAITSLKKDVRALGGLFGSSLPEEDFGAEAMPFAMVLERAGGIRTFISSLDQAKQREFQEKRLQRMRKDKSRNKEISTLSDNQKRARQTWADLKVRLANETHKWDKIEGGGVALLAVGTAVGLWFAWPVILGVLGLAGAAGGKGKGANGEGRQEKGERLQQEFLRQQAEFPRCARGFLCS